MFAAYFFQLETKKPSRPVIAVFLAALLATTAMTFAVALFLGTFFYYFRHSALLFALASIAFPMGLVILIGTENALNFAVEGGNIKERLASLILMRPGDIHWSAFGLGNDYDDWKQGGLLIGPLVSRYGIIIAIFV